MLFKKLYIYANIDRFIKYNIYYVIYMEYNVKYMKDNNYGFKSHCIKSLQGNWADEVRIGGKFSLYTFFSAIWYYCELIF